MPLDDFSDTVPLEPLRAPRVPEPSMLERVLPMLAGALGALVLFAGVLAALLWLPRGPK